MDAMAGLKPVDRRGLDEAALARSVLDKMIYAVGRDPARAGTRDWGVALSLAVRDGIIDCWMESTNRVYRVGSKRVEGMGPLLIAEQREHGYASQQPEFVLRRPKVVVSE